MPRGIRRLGGPRYLARIAVVGMAQQLALAVDRGDRLHRRPVHRDLPAKLAFAICFGLV